MPHPFSAPINIQPRTTKTTKVADVRCTCSPYCQGASSRDWLTCIPGCRACRPSPWQAPVRTSVFAERPEHLGGERG